MKLKPIHEQVVVVVGANSSIGRDGGEVPMVGPEGKEDQGVKIIGRWSPGHRRFLFVDKS